MCRQGERAERSESIRMVVMETTSGDISVSTFVKTLHESQARRGHGAVR